MKNTENLKGFTSDLDRLKSTFKKGKQDIDHLRSIELVINICSGLIEPDTLMRDNKRQSERCHHESKTNT